MNTYSDESTIKFLSVNKGRKVGQHPLNNKGEVIDQMVITHIDGDHSLMAYTEEHNETSVFKYNMLADVTFSFGIEGKAGTL